MAAVRGVFGVFEVSVRSHIEFLSSAAIRAEFVFVPSGAGKTKH
jgi:hypothetical protein